MGTYIHFTDEQKERANSVDLAEFLRRRGEKLLRSGWEFRLGSRHRITVRGSEWYDHAARQGGRAVSFLQTYYGMSYQAAMEALLGDAELPPARQRAEEEPRPFALPPPSRDMRRVYAYLMKQRHISREVITHFAKAGLLYEDAQYHNCVFVGTDEQGIPRHAHKRSTNIRGRAIRANVAGSRPQYSFHHVGTDSLLYVFEAPIDLLSFLTLYPEGWQEHSYVALCGVSAAPIHHLLETQPQLEEVTLCLDSDEAGQAAARRIAGELLREWNVTVSAEFPNQKDWNDELLANHQEESESMTMSM